jgi:isopenicillin-N N-acyltransferase-like protein
METERSHYPFPVIELAGEPGERGRLYGSRCKERIGQAIQIYRRLFKLASNLDWDQSVRKAGEFGPFIQEYDGEIMQEIEGIAEGCGRSVEEILALNVRSELLFLMASGNQNAVPACTALAITPPASGSNSVFIAQNWDWYPQTRDLCVILKIRQKDRPNIIQFVEAGIIAKIGFNSAGLGLCTNALISDQCRVGVPYHAILRKILNAETLADAIGAVTAPQRASSGNYLIGHAAGEAIDIEAAPYDFNVILSEEGVITHANHFCVKNPNIRDTVPCMWPETIMREFRIRKLLAGKPDQVDIDFITGMLRDHFDKPYSVCAHPVKSRPEEKQGQTNASIVMQLDCGTMAIAKGPPCEHQFITIRDEALMRP